MLLNANTSQCKLWQICNGMKTSVFRLTAWVLTPQRCGFHLWGQKENEKAFCRQREWKFPFLFKTSAHVLQHTGADSDSRNTGQQEQQRWEWGIETDQDTKTHSKTEIKIRKKMLMNGWWLCRPISYWAPRDAHLFSLFPDPTGRQFKPFNHKSSLKPHFGLTRLIHHQCSCSMPFSGRSAGSQMSYLKHCKEF